MPIQAVPAYEQLKKLFSDDEIRLLGKLGYNHDVAFQPTLDAAVAYFETVTNEDPMAQVGLSVLLNTYIVQLVKDFDIQLKAERIVINEDESEKDEWELVWLSARDRCSLPHQQFT